MARSGSIPTEKNLADDEQRGYALLFYWILTAVLIGVYVMSLVGDSPLRAPGLLAGFTVLMAVHLGLHWSTLFLVVHRRNLIWPYLLLQSLIISVMAFMAGGQGVVMGLYMALAGEAVGVLGDLRRSAAAVVLIVGLNLLVLGLINGWANLLGSLVFIVPMTFFVVVYVTIFTRQGKSRAEAERLLFELETAHQQLSEYAARVEDMTLAAERQRMARELHDTLAQGLAGLILQLEAADSHLSQGDSAKAQQIIQQAMGRARSTLSEARQAIGDLRAGPPSPDELERAIREEAERFTNATAIPCGIEVHLPGKLTSAQAENALRAVSEGLTNVARHAMASQAWVKLNHVDHGLEVSVRDDGSGFNPAGAERRGGHYGLIGLRERARLAGGSLVVKSSPGEGTNLMILLPGVEETEAS